MVSWNNSAPDQVLFGRLFEEICSLSDFLRSTRFGMGIQWGYEMVYTQLCVCIYICIIMYNYMYNYMCTKSPRKKKTWYKGGKKKNSPHRRQHTPRSKFFPQLGYMFFANFPPAQTEGPPRFLSSQLWIEFVCSVRSSLLAWPSCLASEPSKKWDNHLAHFVANFAWEPGLSPLFGGVQSLWFSIKYP